MWSMNRPVFNGPKKNSPPVQTQTKRKIGTLAPLGDDGRLTFRISDGVVEPHSHLLLSPRRHADHHPLFVARVGGVTNHRIEGDPAAGHGRPL